MTNFDSPSHPLHEAARRVADVTVVVATYNRAHYLPEAIESILGQSVGPVRVVIVDDGSTDNCYEVVSRFGTDVEYVRKENGGKASALAMILPTIATEYVWFFDDDDWAYPDALACMLEVVERDPGLAFSFGCVDKARTVGRLTDATVHRGDYRWQHDPLQQQRLRLYRECTVMMTGALMRTRAVLGVGGISVVQLRGQDYDLLIRLVAAYPFAFCDASVYIFREHDGPRGTAKSLHRWADRIAVWATYCEPGGHFLRYRLPVAAFRPDLAANVDEPATCRSALIARAWATAPKLPLQMSVSDLVEAFAVDPDGDLSAHDLMCLSEMFHDEFVAYRQVRALFSLWRLALTPIGACALEALARSAYWRGRRERGLLRRARWVGVAVPMWLLAGFVRIVRRDRLSSNVAANRIHAD